jgi:hypothetical protein
VNDGFLETLDREKDIEAVAFADDLTVLLVVPWHRREDAGGHRHGRQVV